MIRLTRAIESALQVFRQGVFVNFKKNSYVAATLRVMIALPVAAFRCCAPARSLVSRAAHAATLFDMMNASSVSSSSLHKGVFHARRPDIVKHLPHQYTAMDQP
jgi:hypothetical protein